MSVPDHCVVQWAWYGDPAHEFEIGHMLGKDVTTEVQRGVVHANNGALNGDPCPGYPKVLIVIVKHRHEPVEKRAAPETAPPVPELSMLFVTQTVLCEPPG